MAASRIGLAIGLALIGTGAALPASAQFFLQSKDFAGERVKGDEPGMVQPLPGATQAEVRAGLIWNMRAALNVAALQCQFEPTLLTVNNYNAIITDHAAELKGAFDTLNKYFVRREKTKLAGQNALDQFNTRTYSSFATVSAQFGFCQTANSIGRDALFAPRGGFGDIAEARTRELRNSLTPWGEQRFRFGLRRELATLPRLDAACWDKKGQWVKRKCGDQGWPPVGTGIATR